MTTKAYLEQIERFELMMQNKSSEIERLKSKLTSVTVASKEVNVQVSFDKDRMGDTVAKMADLTKELNILVDYYINKRKRIIQQVDSIKDTNMYHVLSGRYISRKKMGEIAIEMKCSVRQVYRIHKNALAEFERIFGKEYKST